MSHGDRIHGLLRAFVIFIVLLGFINHGSAFMISQLQWGNGTSGKLQLGEGLSYGGYSVKAVSFSAPVESDKYRDVPIEPVDQYVELNISKNGDFIDIAALSPGDSYVTPDGELRVTAKQLPAKDAAVWLFERYSPWAVIELDPRGIPHLEVSIDTDRNEYASLSSTEITATVKLKNTGSADAVDVDMGITTKLSLERGSQEEHFEKIEKGAAVTRIITFTSPGTGEKKHYDIQANITGYDAKEIPYAAEALKTISIIPDPTILPSFEKSLNTKIYLKDYAIVSLSLENGGRYDIKNMSITDTIPNSFRLMGNDSLHWTIDLPAHEGWDYHYLVKPIGQNKDGIVFPAAKAEFTLNREFYSIHSDQPKIVVYGPEIVLNKQTDVSEISANGIVTVTVVAKNIGSTLTKVSVNDKLPENATLVSGVTARNEVLEANKEVKFSYVLKVIPGKPVKLPPAKAEYYELGTKGLKMNSMSKEVEIKPKSPTEMPVNPGKPANWIFVTNKGNSPIWDSVSHSGSRSIKISVPGTINKNSGYPQSDMIMAVPRQNYTFSAWVKADNMSSTPAVRVVELDANKKWFRQINLISGKGTNDWTQKQIDFRTGPNTSYFFVFANILNSTGTFWVDDVALKLKNISTTPNLVVNPSFEGDNKSLNVTTSNVNGSSNKSTINETASKPWDEVNTILNILLRCNDKGKSNSTYKACKFFYA
ncbi:Uncharacterised protein [uncultured archaeon]|nr:Uncharacterised protein [uncultured archaeon]